MFDKRLIFLIAEKQFFMLLLHFCTFIALCLRLCFQGYMYSKKVWKIQIVAPSRAKGLVCLWSGFLEAQPTARAGTLVGLGDEKTAANMPMLVPCPVV